jgi:hypothetical protein
LAADCFRWHPELLTRTAALGDSVACTLVTIACLGDHRAGRRAAQANGTSLMSDDGFYFECFSCDHPVSIDERNLPHEDDIITCEGCGRMFARFQDFRAAMISINRTKHGSDVETDAARKLTRTFHLGPV